MSKNLMRSVVVFLSATAIVAGGCGKSDPEENFRLWSNNEAGWKEMADFVGDPGNDLKVRARALEILVDEGGQPSQVQRVVQRAKDKTDVLLALQPALQKMLDNPNAKKQGHAKRVLFDMLGALPDDKKAATRAMIAKWAFGDLTVDDKPERITEKLSTRIRPEEIEALEVEGIAGAEIMLSKGISRDGVMQFLVTQTAPSAKLALVNGLRRYHNLKANVKVTEADLAAIQRSAIPEGLLYYIELYMKLSGGTHPDDKAAASLAIVAAIEWTEKADAKVEIRARWEKDFRPMFVKLLESKTNCDDRWWGAQMMVQYGGGDGFKFALAHLPDDEQYGQQGCAQNDVKKQMTEWCGQDVKNLGTEIVRPVLDAALKSTRTIERLLAIRCTLALGDDAALATLKAYAATKPPERDLKIIDPIIVPQDAQNVAMVDLAAAGAEIIDYLRATDKLGAEGKIDAETVKWRKHYAGYSFERRGKALVGWVEERAADKVARDKAKKEAAGGGAAAPAPGAAPAPAPGK
ncbi:MAG: hypothetical protein EXR79_01975 [Myxococcales bacterium]|nr:hypothetical protein [Myxococcales bacterium]